MPTDRPREAFAMTDEAIRHDLAEIVGPAGILTGQDVSERFDGWPPVTPIEARCIVRPSSTAQVAAILRYCNAKGVAVVAQGGRTGISKGARSTRNDVALSLERLNRVEAIDPVGSTITVEAGVPLRTVQEAADAIDLFYPVDIGARGSATIGGTIATNAGGNRVIRFGMTREQVLGIEVVLADGTVVSSMNRLIKNNAGYDLKQLFIGSEGTLGVITRAVLRLRPKLGGTGTAFVGVETFDRILALLRLLMSATGGMLTSFEVMWSDVVDTVLSTGRHQRPLSALHNFYALIEVGATEAEPLLEAAIGSAFEGGIVSDAVIAKSEAQAASLWAIREDSPARAAALRPAIHFDIGLPQSAMDSYVDSVRARLRAEWSGAKLLAFGHVGDCNLHLTIGVGDDDAATRHAMDDIVYGLLRPLAGSVTAEHGIGLEKRAYLAVSRTPEEIELMQRLKATLDPRQTLNPGKVLELSEIDR
jgi:FAD/FMN-containing dehydrogenase